MAIRRRGEGERINSLILVWSGDERKQISFDGDVFHLPATGEVAALGPGSPFRYESAKDRADDYIPGTIRIWDRLGMVGGNREKVFAVEEFALWVERKRRDLLDQGLLMCDLPEEVDEAKALGRPIWEASQDDRARGIIEAELGRRRRFEERGQKPPRSSSEHHLVWARDHLNKRGTALSAIGTDELVAALSKGAPAPSEAPPRKPFMPERATPSEAAVTGDSLYRQAKALGVKLKAADLDGLLSGDEAVIKDVLARVKEKRADVEAMATTKAENEGAAAAPA